MLIFNLVIDITSYGLPYNSNTGIINMNDAAYTVRYKRAVQRDVTKLIL